MLIDVLIPMSLEVQDKNQVFDVWDTDNNDVRVWLVGKAYHDGSMDIQGVFNTERRAIDACKTENHFVGPMRMNFEYQGEKTEWADAYFPLRTTKRGESK
jgi:hypothetical protein